MRLIIQPDYQSVSQWAAHYVAAKIKAANPTPEKKTVCIGMPYHTLRVCTKALGDLVQERHRIFPERVDFQHGRIRGLAEEHPESYYSFMWNNSSVTSISSREYQTS